MRPAISSLVRVAFDVLQPQLACSTSPSHVFLCALSLAIAAKAPCSKERDVAICCRTVSDRLSTCTLSGCGACGHMAIYLAVANYLAAAAVATVSSPPSRLSREELRQCLAQAESRCRVNFQIGHSTDLRGHLYQNALSQSARVRHMEWLRTLHRHTCITAVATSRQLANHSLVPPTTLAHEPTGFNGDAGSEWWFVPAVLEKYRGADCLVYAFGVQHNDEFANFYASKGCEVFAFDPTVDYYSAKTHTAGVRRHGVTFHPWGLWSTEEGYPYPEADSLGAGGGGGRGYGGVQGELLTLPQIVTRLGHRGRVIAAMKLDCEGCEFATLRDLWCEEGVRLGASAPPIAIASLVTEFHFQYSETLPRLAVAADIERIRYTGLWLREHNYTSFQYAIHPGTHYGYRGGLRTIHPDLEAAGMRPDVCCYLAGFVREDLVH